MNTRTPAINSWDSKESKPVQLWDEANCQVHCQCCWEGTRCAQEKGMHAPKKEGSLWTLCSPDQTTLLLCALETFLPGARGQSPRTQAWPYGGTKWGMSPWLRWCRVGPEAHEGFYSAPVPKPQVKKNNCLHLYLIVVEVAINRKSVSLHFCSCNHGEPGPLPYSCSTADRPGQGSTVMFLLALGLQSVAFIIWIT